MNPLILLGATTPTTLGELVTELTAVFTAIIGLIGDVFNVILTTPILMLTFGFFFVGGIIGLAMRFLRQS